MALCSDSTPSSRVNSKCGIAPPRRRPGAATPPAVPGRWGRRECPPEEGDDLQVDPGRHFAAHLEHGLERGEGRVGDVDVAAHVLHAVGDLPFQGLPGALLDVLVAEQGLALGPALDAFKQRAGAVPLRLAGGLGGVEVDVRLDERRHGKTAGAVQALAGVVGGLFHRHQGGDTAIGDAQLPETFAAAQAQVVNQHGGPLLVCSGCGSAGD